MNPLLRGPLRALVLVAPPLALAVVILLLRSDANPGWILAQGADTPTPTITATPTSERPSPEPEIDKTVNGEQGPITVTVGDSVTFRWVVRALSPRLFAAFIDDSPYDVLDGECSGFEPCA